MPNKGIDIPGTRIALPLLAAMALTLLTACGGSINSGAMGTTVTASFAGATRPSAVAYQSGTTGTFKALALSGSSVSFTLPSGTSAYGFAYICPTFAAANSYSNESIIQATTTDTTSLSLACPSLSGSVSATFDVSAIPGATSTLLFEGYWNNEMYGTSGVQSVSGVPTGTFDVALVAIGANGALAIQIQRGVNVTSSTSIAFPPMTAAEEFGSAPASITNVPSGASSSGFETTYQTPGGLSVILPAPFNGVPQSTYPTVPSSQSPCPKLDWPRAPPIAFFPTDTGNWRKMIAGHPDSVHLRFAWGTNTPAHAAEEAVFVAETLGDRLQYFQMGNEADLFSRHLRDPKTWSAKIFVEEWLMLARAIAPRVPGAKIGMPDVASNASWLTEIADQWPSIQSPPQVTTLTHHYYFGGPATNPEVNIPNLLKPVTMQKVQNTANVAAAAANKIGARVRMTEGNTCYRGGKPGLSDVFAAALWSADYSLLLASNDYSGVNLHGGTGKSVANSVGGSLPGDALLHEQGETPEQIAAHPHPFYTPIATFGSDYVLEPVAYGLKFAGLFSGGTFLKGDFTTKLQGSGINATAYAAKLPGGKTSVIILNKDAAVDLEVELDFHGNTDGTVETETLHAPALDSRDAQINEIVIRPTAQA